MKRDGRGVDPITERPQRRIGACCRTRRSIYGHACNLVVDIKPVPSPGLLAPVVSGQHIIDTQTRSAPVAAMADHGDGAGSAKEWDAFMKDGARLLLEGSFREAVAAFDAAVVVDPASKPRQWQRGLALYYLAAYEEGMCILSATRLPQQ